MKDSKTKKKNNIKKRKRRVRKSFLAIVFIFLLSLLAILSVTVLFPINKVTVSSEKTVYSSNEIIKASGISEGENLLMLSSKNTEEKIITELPYIKSVKVKKKLNGTVVLEPKSAKVRYCIESNDGMLLSDETFKLLEVCEDAPESAVSLTGIKPQKPSLGETLEFKNSEKLSSVKQIDSQLTKYGIEINQIDVTNLSNINITVKSKFKVELGTAKSLNKKLSYLVEMIEQIEKKNPNDEGVINLIYYDKTKEGIFKRQSIG